MDLRIVIVSSLLLPLKLYFQKIKFIDEIADLAPDLPRHYSLWQARHKFKDPKFRLGIATVILKPFLAALGWGFLIPCLLSFCGVEIDWNWSGRALGVALGVAVGVAVGVAFGVAVGVAVGVVLDVAFGVAVGVAVGVARGIAFGVARGIAFDVVFDVAFGVAVGVALGVALGVAFGVAGGVAGGGAVDVAFGVALGVALGVAFGVARGIAFGVASGVASGVSFAIITSHLLVYPIQVCLIGLSWLISRVAPGSLLQILWRLSPVRWDEIIIFPLPGLSKLLVNLYRYDSGLGIESIDEVSRHYYRNGDAFVARGELAFEDARQLDTLPSIASYERGLGWLDSETNLPDSDKLPLLLLKEISQMVDAAEQSDTLRNKISQLRLAEDKAKALRRNPGKFSMVLVKWGQIIADGLVKAEEDRRIREPIRQVYFNDGAPIAPDELPEEESPFKGRLDTVRELEGALANSKRATLLLTGNRRSGKSSLLLQLPRKLGPQVLAAFVDCQSPKIVSSESTSGMLIGLAEEITEQSQRNVNKFRRDPVKFPRIDREAFDRDPYPAFAHWMEGAERALGGRQLLLCLDEFEKFEEALASGRVDGRLLSLLRNIIQHHSRIIVLLAGTHQLDELPPRWADALVSTQSIKISFLEEADARELIVQPVKGFPDIYQPAAVERILGLTRSQPYLVQLLCGLLVEKMNREHREPPASYVTLDDIEAVIAQAIERGEAYFNDLWRSQTGGNLARRILEELAFAKGERVTSTEIKKLTNDEEGLRATIRTLLRREIIEPTTDGYHITVPLVGYYIRSQCKPV